MALSDQIYAIVWVNIKIRGKNHPLESGSRGDFKLVRLKLLCLILLGIITLGTTLGAYLGLEIISTLPSLREAYSRAIMITRTVFHALRHLGLDGAQTLTLSMGIGIFANNAFMAMLVILSPIPILAAKPFSDKYLSKLYYKHGIWLFKPIGWTTYRILSLILPSYALGLQFYLIGGTLIFHGLDTAALTFLTIETIAVSFSCILALLPGLSRNPLQYLGKYVKALKLAIPAILVCLLAAAILESHQLLLLMTK